MSLQFNAGRAGIVPRGDWPQAGGHAFPLDLFRHNNSAFICVSETISEPAPDNPAWMLDIEGVPPGPDGYLLSASKGGLLWTKSPYGQPVAAPVTWYIRPDGDDQAASLFYLNNSAAGENASGKVFRTLYAAWSLFAENFFLTGQGSVTFKFAVPGTYEEFGPAVYLPISVLSPANIAGDRISIVGDEAAPGPYIYKYSARGSGYLSWIMENTVWRGVHLLLSTDSGYARDYYGIYQQNGPVTLSNCVITCDNGPRSSVMTVSGSLYTQETLTINNDNNPATYIWMVRGAMANLLLDTNKSTQGSVPPGRITINADNALCNGSVIYALDSGMVTVQPTITWQGSAPYAKRYSVSKFGQLSASGRLTAIPGLAGSVDSASYGLAT